MTTQPHTPFADCWCHPVIEHVHPSGIPAAERARMYRELWIDAMSRLAPLLELFDLAEDATTGDIIAAIRDSDSCRMTIDCWCHPVIEHVAAQPQEAPDATACAHLCLSCGTRLASPNGACKC